MTVQPNVDHAVVIPAYDPGPSLVEVVRALAEKGVPAIVLIDDGSGPEYRDRFEHAASFPHVYLLRHDLNRGKGATLKTGIRFAMEHFPNLTGIVTADADGQHHPDDIERIIEALPAAQNYDPNGALYSANRYIGVDGTSLAAAMAAGGAALVKQAHPAYTPAQIQSALENTAGAVAGARSITVGGGLMNLSAAVASTVTAVPSSAGFGVVSGTAAQNLTLTNTGTSNVTLGLSVSVRDADRATTVSVSPASLNLAAGASGTITVSLSSSGPAPGIYEGVANVTGGAVPIRIPYLYLAGDAMPFSSSPILGQNFVTESGSMVDLAFRVLDRYARE